MRVANDRLGRLLWKAVPAGDAEAPFAVQRRPPRNREACFQRDAAEVRPDMVGAFVTIDVRVGDVAHRSRVRELCGQVSAELGAEHPAPAPGGGTPPPAAG